MAGYKIPRRHGANTPCEAVPATEAAKTFGRLVNRVREERATYVIERGGEPVAQIGPVKRRRSTFADFKAWAQTAPHVDQEYLREVEGAVRHHNRPRVRRNPWAR
jgi:antitoxin (DNA-binding transcriptional repressor) of toxin-antitoxin stability system